MRSGRVRTRSPSRTSPGTSRAIQHRTLPSLRSGSSLGRGIFRLPVRPRRKVVSSSAVLLSVVEATTHRPKVKRARLFAKTAGAIVVFAALSLPLSSLARADSSNLLPNGSFQSGTSGWKATDPAFTSASDGASDGFAGRLALNTTARTYQLATAPRPVLNTSAGLVYTANGMVRSDMSVSSSCMLLKDFTSGGALVLKSDDCTLTGSQWAPLPQVALTAQSDGDAIVFIVRRPSGAVAGESFEVDALSLVASGDSTPPPPPP